MHEVACNAIQRLTRGKEYCNCNPETVCCTPVEPRRAVEIRALLPSYNNQVSLGLLHVFFGNLNKILLCELILLSSLTELLYSFI